jgi:hypothetical protein
VVKAIERQAPRVPAQERGQARTHPREPMTMMRFYDGQHGFYAGIDRRMRARFDQ